MNARNGTYISRYNDRKDFPTVDNKLKTKRAAIEANLPVPQLYGVISIQHEINTLHETLRPFAQFVIKPAQGSGGDGILVITQNQHHHYQDAGGALFSQDFINYHVANILSGMYSLGGHPDQALIEYCVQSSPVFEPISFQGIPDIRIIVFRGYPVMAMLRLPTHLSHGKANLHQGAIGVGINMKTGILKRGIWKNKIIDRHPDTGCLLEGFQIPAWSDLLLLAARCADLTTLGYIGVDVVLDRDFGPMMLELNARPGLSIQLANQAGLVPRLEKINSLLEYAPRDLHFNLKTMDRVTQCVAEFG